MHYVRAGSGRPLLLIHGLVGSGANWRRNIGALSQEASVYALDLANMGKSQRTEGLDASLEATADRIVAVMDALDLDEADIAGHSHGGAVALMLAARHPERVRSLVLFAPANPYNDLSDSIVRIYSSRWGGIVAAMAPYFPEAVQRIALGRMYGDPARIPDGCLQGYVTGLRVPGTVAHVLAIVRRWFTDMRTLDSVLPQIASVPTLLVWGDRDRAVSLASGVRLNRELGTSELVVVPGGGHVVFEEMPEESNRLMLEWLRRDLVSALVPSPGGSTSQRREAPQPRSIAARGSTAAAKQRLLPGN
jgi:4,5:9,10-diseco-3-hydroxy-5,9,17-trioxoandrosta-1(10),2-diene-4-oate hydrolase